MDVPGADRAETNAALIMARLAGDFTYNDYSKEEQKQKADGILVCEYHTDVSHSNFFGNFLQIGGQGWDTATVGKTGRERFLRTMTVKGKKTVACGVPFEVGVYVDTVIAHLSICRAMRLAKAPMLSTNKIKLLEITCA